MSKSKPLTLSQTLSPISAYRQHETCNVEEQVEDIEIQAERQHKGRGTASGHGLNALNVVGGIERENNDAKARGKYFGNACAQKRHKELNQAKSHQTNE